MFTCTLTHINVRHSFDLAWCILARLRVVLSHDCNAKSSQFHPLKHPRPGTYPAKERRTRTSRVLQGKLPSCAKFLVRGHRPAMPGEGGEAKQLHPKDMRPITKIINTRTRWLSRLWVQQSFFTRSVPGSGNSIPYLERKKREYKKSSSVLPFPR